jgi:putative ABC transport system permease protein
MIRIVKSLKDLAKDLNKSIMVLAAITIGIIAAGSVITAYFLLNRETKDNYLSTNPASVIISTGPLNAEVFSKLKGLDEVKDAEIRLKIEGRALTSTDWKPLWLFVTDNFFYQKINIFDKYQGKFPPGKGEILLERMALSFAKKNIGDDISIKLKNVEEKNLKISGTVYDMGLAPAWMENMVYGYITPETLEYLGKTDALNEIRITVSGDRASKKNIAEKTNFIMAFLESNNIKVYEINIPKPLTHPHITQMNSLLYLQGAFGLLALILSSIITANLIFSIMWSQVRQIGIMKTLGATKMQISGMYLAMILIISLISLAIGIPISIYLGKMYSYFVADRLNIRIINENLPVLTYFLIIMIGLIIPLSVAEYPVIKGVKTKVIEALRDYGISMTLRTKVSLSEKILTKLFSFYSPLLLSIQNTFRKKTRLLLTVLVISISGSIFISAMFVKSSIREMIKTCYGYMNYSFNISLVKFYPVEIIKTELDKISGIKEIEFVKSVKGFTYNKFDKIFENIKLVGRNSGSDFYNNPVLEGENLSGNSSYEIVLSDGFFINNPGYHVGDNLDISINGTLHTFKIIGEIKEIERTIGYIPLVIMTDLISGENLANEIHIRTDNQSFEFLKNKKNEIDKIFKQSGIEITGLMSVRELEKALADHMELVISFLILMSFVILIIGGLGLSITSSINVIERTREIGISRSIGGTTFNLSLIFIIEGMIVGLISFVISVMISYPLSYILGNYFSSIMLNTSISFKSDPGALFIWLVTVMAAGGIINFLPVYNVCQEPVKDAIIYE